MDMLMIVVLSLFCTGAIGSAQNENIKTLPQCTREPDEACIEYDDREGEGYFRQNITVTMTLKLEKQTFEEMFLDKNKLAFVSIEDEIIRGFTVNHNFNDRWNVSYHFEPFPNGWGRLKTLITVKNLDYKDDTIFHMEVQATSGTLITGGKTLIHVRVHPRGEQINGSHIQPENSVTPDGRNCDSLRAELNQCQTEHSEHPEMDNNTIPATFNCPTIGTTCSCSSNSVQKATLGIMITLFFVVLLHMYVTKKNTVIRTRKDGRDALDLKHVSIGMTGNEILERRQCLDLSIAAGHTAMIFTSENCESLLHKKYYMNVIPQITNPCKMW